MTGFSITIPPGQSAPFATVTPTDHRAWIIISTALGLSMSLLFAAIRVFIRSATKHGYGKDDYALAVATVWYYDFKVCHNTANTFPAIGKRTVRCALELMRGWSWKVKNPPWRGVIDDYPTSEYIKGKGKPKPTTDTVAEILY